MERPSHSIRALPSQSGSRHIAGVSLSLLAQLAFAATFIGGIVVRTSIAPPPDIEMAKIKDIQSRTPPPVVRLEKPAMPAAQRPVLDIAPESGGSTITTVTPQPPNNVLVSRETRQPPPAMPDRVAAAIAQTHTAPPYPTLARRLGVEGKVTLRLTVRPDGTVAKAEVVASSGRTDLDQAAAQWITGHWTYRPAIRDGAPAASQVMAAIQFNLNDAR